MRGQCNISLVSGIVGCLRFVHVKPGFILTQYFKKSSWAFSKLSKSEKEKGTAGKKGRSLGKKREREKGGTSVGRTVWKGRT